MRLNVRVSNKQISVCVLPSEHILAEGFPNGSVNLSREHGLRKKGGVKMRLEFWACHGAVVSLAHSLLEYFSTCLVTSSNPKLCRKKEKGGTPSFDCLSAFSGAVCLLNAQHVVLIWLWSWASGYRWMLPLVFDVWCFSLSLHWRWTGNPFKLCFLKWLSQKCSFKCIKSVSNMEVTEPVSHWQKYCSICTFALLWTWCLWRHSREKSRFLFKYFFLLELHIKSIYLANV